MTHSGGKSHAVGDRGQRFEVRYQLGDRSAKGDPTYVMGWTGTQDGVDRMVKAIKLHPAFCNPKVIDRNLEKK